MLDLRPLTGYGWRCITWYSHDYWSIIDRHRSVSEFHW